MLGRARRAEPDRTPWRGVQGGDRGAARHTRPWGLGGGRRTLRRAPGPRVGSVVTTTMVPSSGPTRPSGPTRMLGGRMPTERPADPAPGPPAGTPAIDLTDVAVVRDGVALLDDVTWTVGAGERWALLGPNGSGKTTLLRVAGAGLWPTRGTVEILGDPLGAGRHARAAEAHHVGQRLGGPDPAPGPAGARRRPDRPARRARDLVARVHRRGPGPGGRPARPAPDSAGRPSPRGPSGCCRRASASRSCSPGPSWATPS